MNTVLNWLFYDKAHWAGFGALIFAIYQLIWGDHTLAWSSLVAALTLFGFWHQGKADVAPPGRPIPMTYIEK